MKKYCLKYLIALFFVSLYFFKGAATVWPVFFTATVSGYNSEILVDAEKEGEKNVPGESTGKEVKESYLNHLFLLYNTDAAVTALSQNRVVSNAVFKQVIYLSIPTPPPKKAQAFVFA